MRFEIISPGVVVALDTFGLRLGRFLSFLLALPTSPLTAGLGSG